MSANIGLIGLRGHTGSELVRLFAERDDMALTYAASRQGAGGPASALAPEAPEGLMVATPEPDNIPTAGLDAVVLALPNAVGAPYRDALESFSGVVVDLSADMRFQDGWAYGLPETGHREALKTARRIANPGCYATATQLALWPIRDQLTGPAVANGISGYSGAGTTPSPRNDAERLSASLMPYALAGHGHEAEISAGVGRPVWFSPHVAGFFRGLVVTVNAPVDDADKAAETIRAAYSNEPRISLQDEPVEIRDVAEMRGACLGGITPAPAQGRIALTAGLDNLLKGAAEQAVQNLALALGLEE